MVLVRVPWTGHGASDVDQLFWHIPIAMPDDIFVTVSGRWGFESFFLFSLRMAALIFRAAGDFKGFLVEPRYHEPAFQAAMNLSPGLPGQRESERRDSSTGKTSLAVFCG